MREAGHIPLLESEWAQVSAMVKAARAQLHETDAKEAFRKGFGEGEQTILWQEGAVWCRIRPDWLQNQRGRRVIYDYKTTGASAEPASWSGRAMLEIGGDIQSELYAWARGASSARSSGSSSSCKRPSRPSRSRWWSCR